MGDNVKEKALDILRLFVDSYSKHSGRCNRAYNEALALLKEAESAPNPTGFDALAFELGFDRKTVYVKSDPRSGEYGYYEVGAAGPATEVVKFGAMGRQWSCVFPTAADFREWAEDAT